MPRNLSLDILKLILAFFVIGIHTGFLRDVSQLGCYLTVNGLFRMAVPVFLVINGFYFASVINNPGTWFKRVLLLYIFWMLLYIYYWFPTTGLNGLSIAKFIKTVLIGYEHLWYVPAMLGAAFILYLLRKMRPAFLLIMSVLLFVVGASIQYVGNYHLIAHQSLDNLANTFWIYRSAPLFAFPFFCIGYLVRVTELNHTLTKSQCFIGAVASIGLLLGECCFNYFTLAKWEGFDIFFSLLLACPMIFLLFLKLDIKGQTKTLALYSTAIYFIHFLIMLVIEQISDARGTLLTLYVSLASVAAAFFLVRIHRRFKFIL